MIYPLCYSHLGCSEALNESDYPTDYLFSRHKNWVAWENSWSYWKYGLHMELFSKNLLSVPLPQWFRSTQKWKLKRESMLKEVLYKKEWEQNKLYWNRAHGYCSFISLKWSRELQYLRFFLLLMIKFYPHYFTYKYNLTCSLSLTPYLSTIDKKPFKLYVYFLLLDLFKVSRSTPLIRKVRRLVNHY